MDFLSILIIIHTLLLSNRLYSLATCMYMQFKCMHIRDKNENFVIKTQFIKVNECKKVYRLPSKLFFTSFGLNTRMNRGFHFGWGQYAKYCFKKPVEPVKKPRTPRIK